MICQLSHEDVQLFFICAKLAMEVSRRHNVGDVHVRFVSNIEARQLSIHNRFVGRKRGKVIRQCLCSGHSWLIHI